MIDPRVPRILAAHDPVSLMVKGLPGHAALDAIPDVATQLVAVACAADQPVLVRFAAAEAGQERAPRRFAALDAGAQAALADVYARAIKALPEVNLFGLPLDVLSSATARRLIALGVPAAIALRPLLLDRAIAPYSGSEEATLAAMNAYRYRDLAAALIAAIRGESFADAATPEARDGAIDALDRTLAAPARP